MVCVCVMAQRQTDSELLWGPQELPPRAPLQGPQARLRHHQQGAPPPPPPPSPQTHAGSRARMWRPPCDHARHRRCAGSLREAKGGRKGQGTRAARLHSVTRTCAGRREDRVAECVWVCGCVGVWGCLVDVGGGGGGGGGACVVYSCGTTSSGRCCRSTPPPPPPPAAARPRPAEARVRVANAGGAGGRSLRT